MAWSIIFDFAEFQNRLSGGLFTFSKSTAPFINTDRRRYGAFKKMLDLPRTWRSPDFSEIRKRTSKEFYRKIRGACGLTLSMAATFFPGYRFFVEEFLRDEWVSSVDWHKGFHRDHVIHQVLTAYVGHTLFHLPASDNPFATKQTLLQSMTRKVLGSGECAFLREHMQRMGVPERLYQDTPANRILWEDLIQSTFYMAALFHDIGYPWQFSANVHKVLDPFMPMVMPHDIHQAEVTNKYGKSLLFAPFRRYTPLSSDSSGEGQSEFADLVTKALANTHGLPGALGFLHLNDNFQDSPGLKDRPLRRFCLEWAALAIMMHDFGKMYATKEGYNDQFRVSYNKDPLSFLLTLCDVIQSFERPNAIFAGAGDDHCRVEYTAKCSRVTLEWDNKPGILTVQYHYPKYADRMINEFIFLPAEERSLFDNKMGFIDFSSTRIKRVKMRAASGPHRHVGGSTG